MTPFDECIPGFAHATSVALATFSIAFIAFSSNHGTPRCNLKQLHSREINMCTIRWVAFRKCKHRFPRGGEDSTTCDKAKSGDEGTTPNNENKESSHDCAEHHYDPQFTMREYCDKCQVLMDQFTRELGIECPADDRALWVNLYIPPKSTEIYSNVTHMDERLSEMYKADGPDHRGDEYIADQLHRLRLIKACAEELVLRKRLGEKDTPRLWDSLRNTPGFQWLVQMLVKSLLRKLMSGSYDCIEHDRLNFVLHNAYYAMKDRAWKLRQKTDAPLYSIFEEDFNRQLARYEESLRVKPN